MWKTGRRMAPTLVVLAVSLSLVSGAEARYRKYYGYYPSYDFRYSRYDNRARAYRSAHANAREFRALGQDPDDGRWRTRGGERRGRSDFSVIVADLIRGCGEQATELSTWPLDTIVEIVRPDETQRGALEALRNSAAAAVDKLMTDCPREIPASFGTRLVALMRGIDSTIAALDAVRPAMQTFYSALDDEQKARLLLRPPSASVRTSERQESRRRRSVNVDRTPSANRPGTSCEQLAATLRDWPIRRIERDARLSDAQRVALYELAAASLRSADSLTCSAETALTPVGRLDLMRARLSAIRAAVDGIRPPLLHFYETLDSAQQLRFAQM